MQSKYIPAEKLELCTHCEVCRRTFETRQQFEQGCEKCAPPVVKPPRREWYAKE